MEDLGLWCLTPLSMQFCLYRGSQFYWWGIRGTRKKHRPAASH